MTTAPDEKPSQIQSGYNDQERKGWNDRLKLVEQLLEIDTRFTGQQIRWKPSRNAGESGAQDKMEVVAAAGAVSVSKYLTKLNNASGSTFAATLAAPTQDGDEKMIYLGTATHTVTVAGTHIFGNTSKTATFTNTGDWLKLEAANGIWVVVGASATFA